MATRIPCRREPSPQARLRIRHFREPQLKKWLVYEIVACLPLLLQLSLGLFFVGLCYFTSSIHQSVGHTTFPLVVGWALCFFGATALPIFFPRCPYRTTLLKAAVAHLHRGLYIIGDKLKPTSTLDDSGRASGSNANAYLSFVVDTPPTSRTRLKALFLAFRYTITSTTGRIHPRCLAVVSRLFFVKQWRACYIALRDASAMALTRFKDTDERLLVVNSASDLGILVSVDAIQANDELLGTTIAEALQHIRPRWDEVYFFLMRVISNRVPVLYEQEQVIPRWPFDDIFPLKRLRPQARESIARIVYESFDRTPLHQDIQPNSMWLCKILLLISVQQATHGEMLKLQYSHHPSVPGVPAPAIDCLSEYFHRSIESGSRGLISSTDHWRYATLRLRLLTSMRKVLNLDLVKGIDCFAYIWTEVILAMGGRKPHQLRWYLPESRYDDRHFELVQDPEFAVACTEYICALLGSKLASFQVDQFQEDVSQMTLYERALGFLVHFCSSRSLSWLASPEQKEVIVPPLVHIIISSLNQERSADILLSICKAAIRDRENYPHFFHALIWGRKGHTPSVPFTDEDLRRLSSCINAHLFQSYTGLLELLNLCHAAIFLFLVVDAKTAGVENCREVFTAIASTIQRHRALDSDVDQELTKNAKRVASWCLSNMESERDWETVDSMFPDELIEVLGQLTNAGDRPWIYRLQALERRRADRSLEGTVLEQAGPARLDQ